MFDCLLVETKITTIFTVILFLKKQCYTTLTDSILEILGNVYYIVGCSIMQTRLEDQCWWFRDQKVAWRLQKEQFSACQSSSCSSLDELGEIISLRWANRQRKCDQDKNERFCSFSFDRKDNIFYCPLYFHRRPRDSKRWEILGFSFLWNQYCYEII